MKRRKQEVAVSKGKKIRSVGKAGKQGGQSGKVSNPLMWVHWVREVELMNIELENES